MVNFSDLIKASHAKGLLEVFERTFRLGILLVQQVIQDVLVALNKSLRILLTVLELLVTIALDAFEEGSESQLLLVTQLGLLLLNDSLHLCFKLVSLKLLKQVSLHFDFLSLFVTLHAH